MRAEIEKAIGGTGADILVGNALANELFGGDGVDNLNGGLGTDSLFGGNGSDILIGGGGSDRIFGDTGTDTVNFLNSTSLVNVNLLTGTGVGGDAQGDTYSGVESFVGSRYNDIFVGGNVAARIEGYIGNDNLTGGSGADVFIGGAGADTINGNGGTDRATYSSSSAININLLTNINTGGEALGDVLTNIEDVSGSAQGDIIVGNTAKNRLFGQAGADRLDGGVGADTLAGGLGSDSFVFNLGQSGTTSTTHDFISDYAEGVVGIGDEIDANVALLVGGVATTATTIEAAINAATGVATFAAGSGTTLADALADITTSMTTGTNAAGEFAFFRVNNAGDYYMFMSDGTAGVTANDVLVRMTAVTAINSISIDLGDVTILA